MPPARHNPNPNFFAPRCANRAWSLGASNWRLLWQEILPNVTTTVIVFIPIMIALAMLTEAALSFLAIGVQPPDASWGTIINDGQAAILTMEAVVRRPVVVNRDGEEAIVVRSIMTSCLTFDHRVVDGAPAARFLQYLAELIQNPASFLTS